MARKARFCQPGIPVLIHQRASSDVLIIDDNTDLEMMQTAISGALQRAGCELHAFGFLPNQLWLVLTPSRSNSIQKLMQSVGRRYAAHFFERYAERYPKRKALWGQRYRCVPLEAEEYLIKAMCYVENTVELAAESNEREATIAHSSAWQHGKTDGSLVVKPHLQYQHLADSMHQRFGRYREICAGSRESLGHTSIASAIEKQVALGSAGFIHALEVVSGIRLSPGRPGRPKKID